MICTARKVSAVKERVEKWASPIVSSGKKGQVGTDVSSVGLSLAADKWQKGQLAATSCCGALGGKCNSNRSTPHHAAHCHSPPLNHMLHSTIELMKLPCKSVIFKIDNFSFQNNKLNRLAAGYHYSSYRCLFKPFFPAIPFPLNKTNQLKLIKLIVSFVSGKWYARYKRWNTYNQKDCVKQYHFLQIY